jgi:PAS domain S-box-containing protein
MADFVSHENRVRLFLAFLIIVLVIVNSQSLHFSHTTRKILTASFDEAARAKAELVASRLATVLAPVGSPASADRFQSSAGLSKLLQELAEEHGTASACLLDWNGRILAGSSGCQLSDVLDFDRLDRVGKYKLVDRGWTMTKVSPAYQPESASAFGYLALRYPGGAERGVLRVQFLAASLAETNRNFRSTLVYQISALSLVLLTLVLFLNSLLAPHRRLVAEARSVAGHLAVTSASEDEGQFLLSTFQDVVAKLKEKEKQLAEMHRLEKARADETEALATDIIQSMTTGLVSLDHAGRVVLVNPAAERIFGVDALSLKGKSFKEALPGSEALAEWMARALGEGSESLRRRVDYRRRSGESIHLGTSVLPLPSTEGEVRGALCLFADLTEVVELRQRLFIKENLARLGELAAGIAHEFRNSLATILGNAKLLGRSVFSEEDNRVVDALVEECSSLSRVVTEFLQFARPETLRTVRFDMAEMVRDLSRDLEPQASAAKVQLRVETRSFQVDADEMLIRKAVSNLVLNAIEAASENDGEGVGEVRLEAGGRNGFAFVRVSDNGPGIREKDLLRIFSPFFTTKSEGTGLGLSIVQKIAVSHNGEVEVKSEPGDGTTFTLNLPAQPDGTTATEEEWV